MTGVSSSRAADIAIVGLACRFPEACNAEQFWLNLRGGRESVQARGPEELLAAGVTADELDNPDYVPVVAATGELDQFDARLFGLTPKEAAHTDPQIRLFLEVAHAALENAGYDPFGTDQTVAVYASAGTNRYVDLYLGAGRDASSSASMAVSALNNTDYVASTVAYKLDLTGAAITLSTACSSSLVGLHLACQAIRNGECDLAVVGGADIEYPVGHGYVWDEGGPVSRSGHVRPFGADADGTVFSSGGGAVVVKSLADAIEDGDYVWAVVRGSAINNDGGSKAGFTAPSIPGQAAMLTEAMAMASILPEDLDYVEAHATGTVLGDPVELAALEKAFKALSPTEPTPGGCGLGSVKGNVGHLGHAAGIASLIKVVLCLDRAELVPTINAESVNEHIDIDRSAFRLVDRLRDWPRSDRPRIAGVSSFGIGGTNAHIVLAEAPPAADALPGSTRPQLLTWSGRVPEAADAYGPKLGGYLAWRGPSLGLDPVSATLQASRTRHQHRRALAVTDLASAASALTNGTDVRSGSGAAADLLLAFPGQGAQHARMAGGLYGVLPEFSAAIDECFESLEAAGCDVRAAWLEADDARLTDTALAQPLLFAVEVALQAQWRAWGIGPAAVCAHSVGEIAAAVTAGVLDVADAAQLVAARVEACVAAPPGRMLAVALSAAQLGDLPPGLHLSAVNAARQVVLGGAPDDVEAAAAGYARQGVAARTLATSRAFHTPLMGSAVERFALAIDHLPFKPPELPYYSGAVGGLIDDGQAVDPRFWAEQLAAPVRFDQLVEALGAGPWSVLECGPGRTLTSLMHARADSRDWPQVGSLPPAGVPADDAVHLTDALGRLWVAGQRVDWHSFRGDRPNRRVPLPGYPYQRTRHWVDRAPAARTDPAIAQPTAAPATSAPVPAEPVEVLVPAAPPAPDLAPEPSPASPISELVWRPDRAAVVPSVPTARGLAAVISPDDPDRRRELVRAVQQAGWRPVLLTPPGTRRLAGVAYPADPSSGADLTRALDEIGRTTGAAVGLVVHALALDPDAAAHDTALTHAVIAAIQAAVRRPSAPGLTVLAARSVDLTGSEPVAARSAMLHGLIRSVAAEHPELGARLIDVGPYSPDPVLATELARSDPPEVVALRGRSRWLRTEVPTTLPELAVIADHSAWLITGAFGGLGREVARGLAGTGRSPRLLLVGRHLPASDDLLVEELTALGAEVRTLAADVAQPRDARRVFDVAAAVFGHLDGVLHLAGVAGDGMVAFRSREQVDAVLAAKVAGTAALAAECVARQVATFVVFSSRAAVDGLAGSADYAAGNAFADAVALDLHRRGVAAMSIAWPSWSEVGMAVDRDERPRPWTVTVDETWPVVDEHRIDRVAVMPGTGHLDLVVRAARDRLPVPADKALDLHDVVYEAVLAVREPRRVEVWFTPTGQQWRFEVWSRPAVGAAGGALRHVSGRIGSCDPPVDRVDLGTLRADFPAVQAEVDATSRLFTLGPRWQTVEALRVGDRAGEKLVELALPEQFAEECSGHALHPTLLDSATASVRDAGEAPHLPFLLERLVVAADLPARLVSHIRRRTTGDGLIVADVDLLDPDGRPLAVATGYTMRQVLGSGFVPADGPAAPTHDDPDVGIPPRRAVGYLLSLLGLASQVPHVVVRPHRGGDAVPLPVSTTLESLSPRPAVAVVTPAVPVSRMQAVAAPAPPSIDTAADAAADLAGETSVEAVTEVIRAIWVDEIGSDDIGPNEDFFALGGNSLTAVGLMSTVRARFGIEMSIAALFDHPTIARLAAAVHERVLEAR